MVVMQYGFKRTNIDMKCKKKTHMITSGWRYVTSTCFYIHFGTWRINEQSLLFSLLERRRRSISAVVCRADGVSSSDVLSSRSRSMRMVILRMRYVALSSCR
jgi:hypothetical protein